MLRLCDASVFSCYGVRLPAHVTSPSRESCQIVPTFLRCSSCIHISNRTRSCMNVVVKRTPRVELPPGRSAADECIVELDAKPDAGGVDGEGNSSKWQASVDQFSPTSTAPDPQQDAASEPTFSKKQAKARRCGRRNKASAPLVAQELDAQRPVKKVKIEAGAGSSQRISRALTVTRGGSQPWRCPSPVPARQGWGAVRIGTSGYVYQHWKNIVYEEGVVQRYWFQMYTRLFDTVEINNTFYRLPAPDVFEGWRDQAPPGFSYALKFSRYLTQMKRLKDPEGPISLFLERANRLGNPMLGPILVQLPPRFDLNLERLECFLKRAPMQYRWAIEFRDSRWLVDDVYALLRAYNASLVIHDHEDIPSLHPQVVTADWIYLRFHGRNYTERYNVDALQKQAVWIRAQVKAGRDVFAYVNNDANGHAVFNALELRDFALGSEESLKF